MSVPQKFNGSTTHRSAILYMVGESVDVFRSAPTTADIAAWMNVSKPTARKYLKQMVKRGELIMNKVPHRQTVYKHTWQLSEYTKGMYELGVYDEMYQIYASRVLKVIAL